MMEKLAQPGQGWAWGARPLPFTISTITYKVVVYAPAERADTYTSPISTLPYMYSVVALAKMISIKATQNKTTGI